MMKTIKFIAYLFYRYYSTGPTKDIPYISTLCALAMLFYIHLVQALILLNKMDLITVKDSDTRVGKYFEMAAFFLPIFLLIILLVSRKELQVMKYDERKVKSGNFYLVVYIIFSFLLLVFLLKYKTRLL